MEKNNFELVKDFDEEVGVGAHKWYGREDTTEENTFQDTNKGEPIVIRHFEFKLNPTLERKPTREEILTPEYIKHLQTLLWADSLRMVLEPRVIVDKETIKIFVPCQARTGAVFTEEPKYLQEWIK